MKMHHHLLVTGPPGVGKTTLIQQMLKHLNDVSASGFFTEEVRGSDGRRVGFDVVSLSGERAPLARTGVKAVRGPKVGQYTVNVTEFERIALPTLTEKSASSLLIIDEIGKMELFSQRFARAVVAAFASAVTIVATVPVARAGEATLLAQLRQRDDVRLVEVSRQNRDTLVDTVTEFVRQRVKPV